MASRRWKQSCVRNQCKAIDFHGFPNVFGEIWEVDRTPCPTDSGQARAGALGSPALGPRTSLRSLPGSAASPQARQPLQRGAGSEVLRALWRLGRSCARESSLYRVPGGCPFGVGGRRIGLDKCSRHFGTRRGVDVTVFDTQNSVFEPFGRAEDGLRARGETSSLETFCPCCPRSV